MINKLMAKYGYSVLSETKHGVYYIKKEPQHFNHIVCVIYKVSGKHIMQSYDEKVIDGRNEVCGVEIPVLFLMWMKAKQMKRKYHWN